MLLTLFRPHSARQVHLCFDPRLREEPVRASGDGSTTNNVSHLGLFSCLDDHTWVTSLPSFLEDLWQISHILSCHAYCQDQKAVPYFIKYVLENMSGRFA